MAISRDNKVRQIADSQPFAGTLSFAGMTNGISVSAMSDQDLPTGGLPNRSSEDSGKRIGACPSTDPHTTRPMPAAVLPRHRNFQQEQLFGNYPCNLTSTVRWNKKTPGSLSAWGLLELLPQLWLLTERRGGCRGDRRRPPTAAAIDRCGRACGTRLPKPSSARSALPRRPPPYHSIVRVEHGRAKASRRTATSRPWSSVIRVT
jgi:hypothetical protein